MPRLRDVAGDDDEVTSVTTRAMADLVARGLRDAPTVEHARAITRGLRGDRAKAIAIQTWVRRNVEYVPDEALLEARTHGADDDTEVVQSADVLLRTRKGDCDCMAVGVATLALAVSVAARFRVFSEAFAREWKHVVAELRVGRRWLTAETCLPGVPLGWAPTPHARAMIQEIRT